MSRLSLYDSLHEGTVVRADESLDVGHLLAGVLEDHVRVVRLATEAVGRHDHGEVVGVHLSDRRVHGLGEDLQVKRRKVWLKMDSRLKIDVKNIGRDASTFIYFFKVFPDFSAAFLIGW